jgi:hypothetical protein
MGMLLGHHSDRSREIMSECKTNHEQLVKLAENSPANQLHRGPGKAYYCHGCGGTFFLELTPAQITVSYGRPAAGRAGEGTKE